MNRLFFVIILIKIGLSACHNNLEHEDPIIKIDSTNLSEIVWSDYLPSSLLLMHDSLWPDQKGHSLFVQSEKLFVIPNNEVNIYIGAIIDSNLKQFPNVKVVDNVDCNSISLSFSTNKKCYHYSQIPSKENMNLIIKDYQRENDSQQIVSFNYDNGFRYNSYKELFLQFSYLGIHLDSILTGERYDKISMSKKNGIAIVLERELFSLDMDIPSTPLNFAEENKDEHVYISSIMFGDLKIMLIEADLSLSEMNTFIGSIKNKNNLTVKEQNVIKDWNISIIDINSKEIKKTGDLNNPIYWFYNKLLNTNIHAVPIYATFANCNDHSPCNVSFSIALP